MSIGRKHTLPPEDLTLPKALHEDRHALAEVDVPIVTTSASFRSDITGVFGEPAGSPDIVFSRAHFSMGVAVMEQGRKIGLTTWLVDPVNYISDADWGAVSRVVKFGRLAARFPVLKYAKDFLDSVARGKLPLGRAITKPLLYVTANVTKPIVSLHYETGNILAQAGKVVLQVITDPHIRPQYLYEAENPNMNFAVFDAWTRQVFLAQATDQGKSVHPARVVVTGPPVDPRIVSCRYKKSAQITKRPLRLVVTTGGLGQNKDEIEQLLKSIVPRIKTGRLQLILYASTLVDFSKMYGRIAREVDVRPDLPMKDEDAPLRIIYHPSIISANKALIDWAFPWADGFVTKPSGDMAYDAVAAGCFLLTLSAWGEWEENVEKVFSGLGIAVRAQPANFAEQLDRLGQEKWFEKAARRSLGVDKIFLSGAQKIVDLQQKLALQ